MQALASSYLTPVRSAKSFTLSYLTPSYSRGFIAPLCTGRVSGHHHIGKLIEHACAVAREHGAARVYLATDHIGLYEKYDFTYLENRVDHDGEDSRIYIRDL